MRAFLGGNVRAPRGSLRGGSRHLEEEPRRLEAQHVVVAFVRSVRGVVSKGGPEPRDLHEPVTAAAQPAQLDRVLGGPRAVRLEPRRRGVKLGEGAEIPFLRAHLFVPKVHAAHKVGRAVERERPGQDGKQRALRVLVVDHLQLHAFLSGAPARLLAPRVRLPSHQVVPHRNRHRLFHVERRVHHDVTADKHHRPVARLGDRRRVEGPVSVHLAVPHEHRAPWDPDVIET